MRNLEKYIKEKNEQLKKDKKSFEQEQKRIARREQFEKTLVTILKPYNDLKNSIKEKQEAKHAEKYFLDSEYNSMLQFGLDEDFGMDK